MTYTIIDPNLIHTDLVRITITLWIAIMLGVLAIASHKRRKK